MLAVFALSPPESLHALPNACRLWRGAVRSVTRSREGESPMRVRRRLSVLVAMGIAVLAMATAGEAITNGQPDGDNHPYVGLAVFDVINPTTQQQVPSHRCSASLLSPTVVLTAAHCTVGTVAARVWFAENVQGNPEYPFSGPAPTTAVRSRTRASATRAGAVCSRSLGAMSESSSCRNPCRRVRSTSTQTFRQRVWSAR